MKKDFSRQFLCLVFFLLVAYTIFLQFIAPVLYGEDSYYHVAVAKFIRQFGLHYDFHWAQFSTFKEFFSDKDLLFHVLICPFTYLTDNIVLAGKYAVIFFDVLFLLAYLYILRKYLPDFLVACFLILPFLSGVFYAYFTFLRPTTLANVLFIFSIYFLINKNPVKLFIATVLFTLSHLFFPLIFIFALITEAIRYFSKKEFYLRNIYSVLLGIALGTIIHPNFPNNLLSFHLNVILVPYYSFLNVPISFGGELSSGPTKNVLLEEFVVFFSFNIIIWLLLVRRIKISFSTLVWWACSSIFMASSFISNRYWYNNIVLFLVFFASFVKDLSDTFQPGRIITKSRYFILSYLCVLVLFLKVGLEPIVKLFESQIVLNGDYEEVGKWMLKNIPANEMIYHAYWSDSPYFIALNPKNNYLVVLDPMYMLYRYPKEYMLYSDILKGQVQHPYKDIQGTFKSKYAFTRKEAPFYSQMNNDHMHFKKLYDTNWSAVFEILPQAEETEKANTKKEIRTKKK
ncbi:MAG: hypothetical protein C4533_00725 [Candidatus Omnitrophota bacterium]|jgi:hypothetical protein|nr:MAG: hypothetical protein C4533_00725 [Candidatus Omnitrophota bacterium]